MFYPLLSLKTNTFAEWWLNIASFSLGQELLASSNLNIHKSGGKTLGWDPNLMRPNNAQPLLPSLGTRPLRIGKHCSEHLPVLPNSLFHICSVVFLLQTPLSCARRISMTLINKFNARIQAHVMCPLDGAQHDWRRNNDLRLKYLCACDWLPVCFWPLSLLPNNADYGVFSCPRGGSKSSRGSVQRAAVKCQKIAACRHI